MIIGSELYLLLNKIETLEPDKLSEIQKNKIYIEYFDVLKKFEGLIIGGGNSLAQILEANKYREIAKKLNPHLTEEAKEHLIDNLRLGDYLLNRDFHKKETTKKWNEFCARICSSQDPSMAKILSTFTAKLVSYDAHEQWLKFIFAEVNDPKDSQKTLAKLINDLNEIDLTKIQQAVKAINSLEKQISQWAEPKNFEGLYENLQESLKLISENLKWNAKASNLEKILITQQVYKLADQVLDESVKALTRSSQYTDEMQDDKGNHLKAARFLKMLEPFLELRNVWRRHDGFKDRKALLAFFERKRHSTLTKKELFPSMHFDVNEAVTLGFGLPITLEDSFTLIHQETLIALNVVNKDLKQIIEKHYPPLLQQLNNQCNHIARGSFIYTTPPTIIDVTSKKISITKVLPLRSHAAILKIQYNCKTGITSVKFSIFGGNDNNRWEHLAVDSEINLRLGDFHFVNKPHFGEQKENFSFEVKIDSIKQIEQLIETIENCIETSYTIADDPGVDINQALHSTYIMRANQIDKLLTLKPELKHSYIDRQILTLQLIKKRASFITHREYFFNLNSNQIEYLCNKVNLTVQVLSKIYYTKFGIIEFLIKNVKEIGTLSEAGFPLKSLLNNENITLEKLQLFVKNSNQIEYFCNKEDFTPQELLKIAPDVVQLLINKVKEIVTLSKTGFPLKSLLNNENITLDKLQLFVKNSNQIEYLHTAGAVPQVLLDMCINRANHFEYIMTNGPEILILSSLGFPIQELFKDNDINKVKFFIDNSYAIDALDKEVKLTLGKMLVIYNSNVNKAKFLTNNYFDIIEILSNTDLTLPEILVTYDSNVNKTEFLIDNYMDILILSDKTNFTIQYVSKIYDNDPGCAKLITNNENKIEDILQEGILTAEDLINCNSSQLTELIKDKITAIQLKASLTQNVQESKNNTAQITKSLKTKAVEIGNAVPLAAITITPSTNIQNIGIKQKGLIAHHGSLMNKK